MSDKPTRMLIHFWRKIRKPPYCIFRVNVSRAISIMLSMDARTAGESMTC